MGRRGRDDLASAPRELMRTRLNLQGSLGGPSLAGPCNRENVAQRAGHCQEQGRGGHSAALTQLQKQPEPAPRARDKQDRLSEGHQQAGEHPAGQVSGGKLSTRVAGFRAEVDSRPWSQLCLPRVNIGEGTTPTGSGRGMTVSPSPAPFPAEGQRQVVQ